MKYYLLQCIFKEIKVLSSSYLEKNLRAGNFEIFQLCWVVFQVDSSMCSLLIKINRYYQLIKLASHLLISLFKIISFLLRKKSKTNITSAKLILILPMQQSLPKDEGDTGAGKREVDNPHTKSSSRRWGQLGGEGGDNDPECFTDSRSVFVLRVFPKTPSIPLPSACES